VANLLDMTRLASGGLLLKRDWVPLGEIVGSALTHLESRLETRTIAIDIPDDLPLLLVDPVLFEQLFVNLLENAEKHTPATSPITITARRVGQQVIIDVMDQGPGIGAAIQEKIFEKFFRAPDVRAPGAGLGLPICRGIAEAHGGTIVAENRPGGGALFRVSIPTGGTPPSLSPGVEEAS
jgi:two-component system sensor histidine kinase KdpD